MPVFHLKKYQNSSKMKIKEHKLYRSNFGGQAGTFDKSV